VGPGLVDRNIKILRLKQTKDNGTRKAAEYIWKLEKINSCKIKINQEIQKAFDFAEISPFPQQAEAYTGVYATRILSA
jgi:TPP-dependent pyruvate/acetoin dehydrogenase alpha subunit